MRRRVVIIIGIVAAAAVIVGTVLFQPWLLFTDVRVDDQIPVAQTPDPTPDATPDAAPDSTESPAAPASPVTLSTGSFVSQEHTTTGTVSIIEQPDGSRLLAIENLDTTNGPDVHVWLSAADAVEGVDGWFLAGGEAFVDLGPIKGNQGNQVYEIPADVDLGAFVSVSLWCVQFGVGFGAAQLVAE